MIIGLETDIPYMYMVKTCPEKEILDEWLKDEFLLCLITLQENGFNVRRVVCADHASNVSAYKKLQL